MEGGAPLRILGETAYPVIAPSARVRLASWVPRLANYGIELDYRPSLSDEDYKLMSSPVSPGRKAGVLLKSTIRQARRRTGDRLLLVHRLRLLNPLPMVDPPPHVDAYDLDDALFIGSAAQVNRRFQWMKRESERCIQCLRRARLVIVGNAYLADRVAMHARRVELIPSCVDPSSQPLRAHAARETVTVGWIGSHTTSAYLASVLPVLERMRAREGPDLRLVLVGADRSISADWIEHRPWRLDTEADELAQFDVGIMPLPDTEWTRGKCGYKVLQYFAAGVPAIASPVGVNARLLDGGSGLAATTPEEWERALAQLIADASERAQRGALARTFVEADYSYARWAPELAAVLRSLA